MYLKNKKNPGTAKRKRSAFFLQAACPHYCSHRRRWASQKMKGKADSQGNKAFILGFLADLNWLTAFFFFFNMTDITFFLWLVIPVAVDGPLKELHGILGLLELPAGWADLSAHAADAGVALKRVGPPLWFLIHHLQQVPPTLLR